MRRTFALLLLASFIIVKKTASLYSYSDGTTSNDSQRIEPQCFIPSLCEQFPAYILRGTTAFITAGMSGDFNDNSTLLMLVIPKEPQLAAETVAIATLYPVLVHFSSLHRSVPVMKYSSNTVFVQDFGMIAANIPMNAFIIYASEDADDYKSSIEYTFFPQFVKLNSSTRSERPGDESSQGISSIGSIGNERSSSASFVGISDPAFGVLAVEQLFVQLLPLHLDAAVDSTPFLLQHYLPEQSYLQFNVQGLVERRLPVNASNVQSLMVAVEPASWFFSITPVLHWASATAAATDVTFGIQSDGYIEFVLSDTDLAAQRCFRDDGYSSIDSRYFSRSNINSKSDTINSGSYSGESNSEDSQQQYLLSDGSTDISLRASVATASSKEALRLPAQQQQDKELLNVCFWGTNKMDGQRQIWLLQTQYMNSSKFRFIWIVDGVREAAAAAATVVDSGTAAGRGRREQPSVLDSLLRIPHAVIVQKPNFPLDPNDFTQQPDDGSTPFATHWQQQQQEDTAGNQTMIFEYLHQRILIAAHRIAAVQPPWCRNIFEQMQQSLQENHCDVVVYGNSRHFNSDVLITDAGRALAIPTVAELLNLFVDAAVIPTAIVAPSTHSLMHPSVQYAVHSSLSAAIQQLAVTEETASKATSSGAIGVVISPSVDSEIFQRNNSKINQQHPKCRYFPIPTSTEASQQQQRCVVIGFVARLSPEKNPGLFLQAAQLILQRLPLARFTVVGDGPLLLSLQLLSRRLGIAWAVRFTGWVPQQQLPAELAMMDAVINTSLRGWSETFCIANIEVMSMAVPLVTFAVGGIGEYVLPPDAIDATVNSSSSDNSTSSTTSAATATEEASVTSRLFSVTSNAVLVHSAQPLALASAALHLLLQLSAAERQLLGQRGRDIVLQQFTVQRQMRQYADLYTFLASSPVFRTDAVDTRADAVDTTTTTTTTVLDATEANATATVAAIATAVANEM